MNLTQLEWIESGLKHKSYDYFKSYCNSRVLIYETTIVFFLSSSSSSHPWKREGRGWGGRAGHGRCCTGRMGHGRRRRGAARAGAWRGSASAAAGHHRAAGEGERGVAGEGKRRGRGAAAGEGEGRVREALHGRENKEHEETLGTTMEVLTGEEDPCRRREEIRRLSEIGGSNRRTERAATKPSTRRTQRYPRIRQTMHGLGVIARRSWNRPELRRTIPGASDWI
jgi:hypothetical protein